MKILLGDFVWYHPVVGDPLRHGPFQVKELSPAGARIDSQMGWIPLEKLELYTSEPCAAPAAGGKRHA